MTSGLLVTNLLIAGLVELPASALRGMNLGYRRMGLGVGLTVMGGLLSALVVARGWGLVGLAASKIAVCVGDWGSYSGELRFNTFPGLALSDQHGVRCSKIHSEWLVSGVGLSG